MMMRTIVYSPFSIVVVPFPFTDKETVKRRPALVISRVEHQKQTHHITLLMITSAKNSAWDSDYSIQSLEETGLTSASIVRQKMFTIDSRLVIKKCGQLSPDDKKEIYKKILGHLAFNDVSAELH